VARHDLTPVFPVLTRCKIGARLLIKINPFLFDDQWPLQYQGKNRTDIFADDSDEK
jgi:hypothetical protein